jgi:hypothetical protein
MVGGKQMNLKEKIETHTVAIDDDYGIMPEDAIRIAEDYAQNIACDFVEWVVLCKEAVCHPDYGWGNMTLHESYGGTPSLFAMYLEYKKDLASQHPKIDNEWLEENK